MKRNFQHIVVEVESSHYMYQARQLGCLFAKNSGLADW